MVENYNPTRKEVLRETFSGVNFKNTGNKLKDIGGNFIMATGIFSLCSYVIPTFIRGKRDANSSGEKIQLNVADKIETVACVLAAAGLYLTQAEGYSYAVEHDHPEALLIPVATNVVSGAYEVGRKIYNNAKQKLISKHNTEGLESVLETTELTLE